jgi:hypothetical protein
MQIFLRAPTGSIYNIEVEGTDTYEAVVTKLNKVLDAESKKARLDNVRDHIKPLITANPKIYFPDIRKYFNEGMKLEDINVRKDMTANFSDNNDNRYQKLRPANSTWTSGMDKARFKEYKELKERIEAREREARERDERWTEQTMNDYYSGNWDAIGMRGGGRRKGRKSKTKRKGSKRKGSRRKGSKRGRKSRRTRRR